MLICFYLEGDGCIYKREKSKLYNWFNYKYTLRYYDPKRYLILDSIIVNDFNSNENNIGYVLAERGVK